MGSKRKVFYSTIDRSILKFFVTVRDGNTEMSQLAKLWPEVNSDDYIAIKKRLGISVESDLALIA